MRSQMRMRFLIGLIAASIPVVAGTSSALAQREDERYLHLEQMRPPVASPLMQRASCQPLRRASTTRASRGPH